MQHQVVMEKELGRPLEEHERVRFKDGDKNNLSPDNLEIELVTLHTERRSKTKVSQLEERVAKLEHLVKILIARSSVSREPESLNTLESSLNTEPLGLSYNEEGELTGGSK